MHASMTVSPPLRGDVSSQAAEVRVHAQDTQQGPATLWTIALWRGHESINLYFDSAGQVLEFAQQVCSGVQIAEIALEERRAAALASVEEGTGEGRR